MKGRTTTGIVLFLAGAWGVAETLSLDRPWFVPLFLSILGLFLALSPELSARKVLRNSPVVREPFEGSADDDQFILESPHGRTHLRWEHFFRALVSRNLILLYISPAQFVVVASQFFTSDADWQTFRRIVTSRVRLRKSSFFLATFLTILVVILIFLLWALFRSQQS